MIDLPVSLTYWARHDQPRGRRQSGLWSAVLESALFSDPPTVTEGSDRPGWSPATFRHDHRSKDRVELVYGVGLDIDEGGEIDRVVAAFGDLAGLVHTTWSHRREKHGVVSDRCRVILVLSRAVTGAEYPAVWGWAAERLRNAGAVVDEGAKDPSRLWYTPSVPPGFEELYDCRHLTGEPVDVDALVVPSPPAAPAPCTPVAPRGSDLWAERALENAAGRVLSAPEGTRNDVLNRESFSLGGFTGAGRLDVDRVVATLERAIVANGGDPSKDGRKIRDGLRAGAEKPRGQDTREPTSSTATASPTTSPSPLHWPEISAPLPPVPWLCKDLHLAPGRPSLLSAPPGAGKTWAAVDLAMAVATEGGACGGIEVQRRGRVVHLNFDYPAASARRRYTRVAYGRRRVADPVIELYNREQLAGMSLVHPGARDWLKRISEGAVLVVIDALRGALPGVDMNDSRVRDYLDLLLEASDATGATFLVIHHDKKAGKDGDKGALKQERAGGSHQIAAGCDVTLHMENVGGNVYRVSAGKVSEGKALDGGYLFSLEDLDKDQAGEDGLSPGVALVGASTEEAFAKGRRGELAGSGARARMVIAEDDENAQRLFGLIRDNAEKITVRAARVALGVRNVEVAALLAALVSAGKIENRGTVKAPKWQVRHDVLPVLPACYPVLPGNAGPCYPPVLPGGPS